MRERNWQTLKYKNINPNYHTNILENPNENDFKIGTNVNT